MRLLLDTHTLLWWTSSDPKLSQRAIDLITDQSNQIIVSAVSVLEIAIKAAKGTLPINGTPRQFVDDEIVANGFDPLPITFDHAVRVYSLPPLHGDPFDRILIAQALTEGVPLVTNDALIGQYGVPMEW